MSQTLSILQRCLRPLAKGESYKDYSDILRAAGDARVVMIGEASHGTHEFYWERCELTKKFIREKGTSFVVVEADWPDAYQLNKYVRGYIQDIDEAFSGFKRFPRWMWRNEVMKNFIQWLRDYNDGIEDQNQKVGFYGLDVYSLFDSAKQVVDYLQGIDKEAATIAKKRYECFDQFHDPQAYGFATAMRINKSCEDNVRKQLMDLLSSSAEEMSKRATDGEKLFVAQQNAKVVKNAEEYYRSMFTKNTWNLRDSHMVEVISDLLKFYHKHYHQGNPRAVVWAHNSHLGDAGATEDRGKTNVGELARKKFGIEQTFNIGFTSFSGTVTAADDWDMPATVKNVNPGRPNSYEEIFHRANHPFFYLLFRSNNPQITVDKELVARLQRERLERAIGVVYRPDTELQSHYFQTNLPRQFDCVIHIDQTNALKPLDTLSYLEPEEPETYPEGL